MRDVVLECGGGFLSASRTSNANIEGRKRLAGRVAGTPPSSDPSSGGSSEPFRWNPPSSDPCSGGSCEVHHCHISSLLVSPSRKLLVPGLLDLLDLLSSAKPTSFQAPNQQRAEKLKGEWLVMEESKVEYRV